MNVIISRTIYVCCFLVMSIGQLMAGIVPDLSIGEVWPLEAEHIRLLNMALYEYTPFLILPSLNHDDPDVGTVWANIYRLGDAGDGNSLFTQMILKDIYPNPEPMYSPSNIDPNIILISPRETEMRVRGLVNPDHREPDISTGLVSITVPEDNDWREASESEREFYSYHREGEWHIMKFPENRTDDFRCVTLKIAYMVEHYNEDGDMELIPTRRTRIWLFIQLPWTDNPAILDHIPHRDFSVYPKLNMQPPVDPVIRATEQTLNVTPIVSVPDRIQVPCSLTSGTQTECAVDQLQ